MSEQNIITGCWDEDCLMCSGEACNLCGAGCWNNQAPHCDHDVIERHMEPESMNATSTTGARNA